MDTLTSMTTDCLCAKGTKDDGSDLTAYQVLVWTARWTTTYTPIKIAKCMLWLLAQCVHPVLEPLVVRYLFDIALGVQRVFEGEMAEVGGLAVHAPTYALDSEAFIREDLTVKEKKTKKKTKKKPFLIEHAVRDETDE